VEFLALVAARVMIMDAFKIMDWRALDFLCATVPISQERALLSGF